MDELRKCGTTTKLRYEREQFLIERAGEGFINLANLYQEYCHAPYRQRKVVLDRFIRGCLRSNRFEIPEDFADVHPDLLPIVRSRFYLESVALQSRARGGESIAVPQQLIGDHLSLSLVYDLPQAMRSIIQADLDRWGVSLYEAVEAAHQNLQQMGNVSFASLQNEGGAGVYISSTGDNYDASRLILLELVRKLPVRGDCVAMVPNRDTLVVTGSDDVVGLEIMAKIAQESFQKPRPISTIALTLANEEWESWLPAASSPVNREFCELRLRTMGMEYNDQKELLDQIHAHNGDSSFVASFSVMKHKECPRLRSYSVWSEGVETLLPETDDLLLLRPKAGTQEVQMVAANSFARVREVVGDLMQPIETYPERYRVIDFPTQQQLKEIGRGDWLRYS